MSHLGARGGLDARLGASLVLRTNAKAPDDLHLTREGGSRSRTSCPPSRYLKVSGQYLGIAIYSVI
jgi:hypothetical protein